MTKIIMKKVNVLMLTLVMVLACEAPNQEIFSEIDRDLALSSTDPNVLQMFAQSAYTPLAGTWGGHNSLWSLHEVSSDELAIPQKGADWEDGGQWIRVHRHQYLPTEESINNGWAYCYSAIGNINNLLKSFGDNPLLRAEFEALRAIIYLWLIDAYGNVPIITEATTAATPATNSRQEVFTFIENSLKDNLDNLREERTYATVNYYVAQTALAKLYLNAAVYTGTQRWADAAIAAGAVIDAGVYSLEADFMSNFVTRNAGSSENIFVINYDEDNAGGFNLPQMTLHYESQRTFRLQQQPWNGYASLEEFYNSFDQNDRRIASFIEGPQFAFDGTPLIDLSAEDDDPDGPPLNFTPEINMLAPNAWRQGGVRVGKFEFRIGAGPSLSNDYPLYRYADVILMRAEALWRQNNGSVEALNLVNQVRLRSNPNPIAVLTADELLAERGREMFAEASRRSDLIRFQRFNDEWWQKPISPATRNLFPIPLPQIQANPSLTQNPGY